MKNNYSESIFIYSPLITAIALALGIFIGATLFGNVNTSANSNSSKDFSTNFQKMKEVLYYIDNYYVDTVNNEELVEHGIKAILEKLDPHTSYISAKDVEISNSQLAGDFQGVGIEFNLVKDTIYIISPIANGPSEAVGIKAGDRIIEVEKEMVAGVKITNRQIVEKLRGKKGTKVEIGIKRGNSPKLIYFTITRDKIPTFTVDVSYKIDTKTAYIKVARFGKNTYTEVKEALAKMKTQNFEQLILDLRGNPGGYMSSAVKISDVFLSGKKKIVYTDGKLDRFDDVDFAKVESNFENVPLIILMNEGSASSSEIVAGALQDNDRALIVGRRSFGKGLVQKPIALNDGSEIHLTISRYYTPSGRSIQKSYENLEEYQNEVYNRYQNGEVFHLDSTKFDENNKFKTLKGRTVYGGGGIMPDFFVPRDTTFFSSYLDSLYTENVFREFSIHYSKLHESELKKMGIGSFRNQFQITGEVEQQFLNFVQNAGVVYSEEEYQTSKEFILNYLKATIARVIWHEEGFYSILNQNDKVVIEALGLFDEAEKLLEE